ncbi:hypothetical protein ACTXT7_008075 [Hymenolepis weldensis]
MNLQHEKDRILEYLSQPSGRHLFQIRASFESYLLLGILLNPGGHIELILPPSPQRQARWDLVLSGDQPHSYRPAFHYNVANMTHGFMACVFLLTKRHGMEMPPDVIQLDPEFYQWLHPMTPSAQYIDNFHLLRLGIHVYTNIHPVSFHFSTQTLSPFPSPKVFILLPPTNKKRVFYTAGTLLWGLLGCPSKTLVLSIASC